MILLSCYSFTIRSNNIFQISYVRLTLTRTSHTNFHHQIQNCRFLQRGRDPEDRAEDESIARLTEALREANRLKSQ